jgi:dTDP-4-dehydrorhamnose 3,5-epimerase
MTLNETTVRGALLIDIEPAKDDRGFFAVSWSRKEWEDRGLRSRITRCGLSFNRVRGTLRGMHYQAKPREEAKLVRCTLGAIYDVVIDLRPESPSFKDWFGVELSAGNRRMMYVPEGVAHGFISLADGSEVFYQISEDHDPDAARGVRWNDPAFGIRWPLAPRAIARRDATYPDWTRDEGRR